MTDLAYGHLFQTPSPLSTNEQTISDEDLDWLIEEIGLTAESVTAIDNDYEDGRCVHTNGYLPNATIEKKSVPKVRTAAGARKYKLPIGTPITRDHLIPNAAREAAAMMATAEQAVRDSHSDFDVRSYMEKLPPRADDEPDFAYHARVFAGLPPKVKHAAIAKVRERTRICQFIADAKAKWVADHHLPQPHADFDGITADLDKAQRVVDAVKSTPRDDNNDYYRRCYDDFKRQNDEMWKLLTEDLGVTVEVWDERVVGNNDPYATAEDQAEDLINNKHLYINRGSFFIGENPSSPTGTNHPFMTEDEYFRFRAVHDAFGHAAVGTGFDRHGEYGAWVSHNAMYTGDGRKAMSTEYHAVNSYLWLTGTPMPTDHWGIILPDSLIQNVYDNMGNVVRKEDGYLFADLISKKNEFARFHDPRKKKGSPHSGLWYMTHPNPKSSPREIAGHHAHKPHGPSILWPALYEHLRAKGMTKGKAAAISNAAWKKKKVGMKTNTPTSVRGVLKSIVKVRHVRSKAGEKRYGAPIGTPIVAGRASLAAAGAAKVAGKVKGADTPVPERLKALAGQGRVTHKGTLLDPNRKRPKVKSVELAAKMLANGQDVELDTPDRVSTLLDKLKKCVDDAEKKGDKAPVYDLCKVTVAGTNLFCVKSKGIPRIRMPQLKANNPVKGSKADKLERDKRGEVDVSPMFIDYLKSELGIDIKPGKMPAANMKASQNQLNGVKVAGIAGALRDGVKMDGAIMVSRDGYVVDGHHRWAATVAVDLDDGKSGNLDMNVDIADIDIITLLAAANQFAKDWGIPQASVSRRDPPSEGVKKETPCLGCLEIEEEDAVIMKTDPERQIVFGWAYVSHDPDGVVNFDKSGEFIDDASELETLAYDFVLKSRTGDVNHDMRVTSQVVESMVFTPEKVEKMGLPPGTLPTGWWVGFKVDDPDVWDGVKQGRYTSFSIHGSGLKKAVEV